MFGTREFSLSGQEWRRKLSINALFRGQDSS
jgi:hypothetical protein